MLLYACARLGAMLVPINWRLAVPEQVYILRDAAVKALVVEQAFAAVVAPLRRGVARRAHRRPRFCAGRRHVACGAAASAASGDGRGPHVDTTCPLLIVYTSGTTGHPKGAVLRQDALVWNAVMSQHMHDMTAQDHVLTVLPMFHVGGLNIQTTPALQLGATVTLHARFAPEATLDAIARDRPTLTVLVPATIQAMIEHPRWAETSSTVCAPSPPARPRCRSAWSMPSRPRHAGAAGLRLDRDLPGRRLHAALRRLAPAGIDRAAGARCARRASSTTLATRCRPARPAKWSCAAPTCSSNTGATRRPRPRRCARAGTTRGDIGTRDADGHFFIHDRKKNLIISGGENIYPAEVERVLRQHPAVADAAVIGRPDAKWQEVPVAYIVARAGRCGGRRRSMERFCLAQLARYKVPREYVFVDSLPRNAMGKVQHFRLKELMRRDRQRAAHGTEQKPDENRRSGRWQWLVGGGR